MLPGERDGNPMYVLELFLQKKRPHHMETATHQHVDPPRLVGVSKLTFRFLNHHLVASPPTSQVIKITFLLDLGRGHDDA